MLAAWAAGGPAPVLHGQGEAQGPATESQAFDNSLADTARTDLRRGRDAFIRARDFSAALNPAEAIVGGQQERRDPEYAADLAALGLIRGELRQTDEGAANLVAAIELVEAAEGPYSTTLIDYYRGLGRTYIKAGEYPEAIATLEQAQHISQRNLGLFNVEQAALLDDITTAYLGLGDTTEAQKVQIERLDNAVRRFGSGDPRVIPFRYVLANYYQRSRLPESAREQYEEVLKSQVSRVGATDAGLLAPLRELVAIDLLVSQATDPQRRDRLAALVAQNEPAEPIERGLSLAKLGDWAVVTGDTVAARDYYRQAWIALGSQQGVDVAAHFAKPAMLDFVAPLNAVDRAERSRPYAWGEIILEFDVTAEGLPMGVRVVSRDTNTTTSLPARYSRRMRETHFRPRLVNGEPLPTSGVRSTHYVRYYVENEDDE